MVQLIQDPVESVGRDAAAGLAHMEIFPWECVASIARGHASVNARVAAIQALAQDLVLQMEQRTIRLLKALLRDKEPRVRKEARRWLNTTSAGNPARPV